MKIPERYKCDFCGKDNPEHKNILIPVITDCEWTEGRACKPWIAGEHFDICDECYLLTTNVYCGFRGEEPRIIQHKAIEDLNNPRWIPVTEKLPNSYEEVLLLFPHNQAAGFIDRDGYWSVYSGDGFYTEVAENEPKPTHWTKKLPELPKEDEPDV